jgi:hypothetical protein
MADTSGLGPGRAWAAAVVLDAMAAEPFFVEGTASFVTDCMTVAGSAVIEAVKEGMRTPGMKDELLALEARKSELAAEVKQAPEPAPRLHPRLADIYRDKVERLRDSLNAEGTRAEAAEALRSLVEEIRLVPEEGHLEIELAGDLAGILALTARSKKPATVDRDGLQVTLVAGTRYLLYRNRRKLALDRPGRRNH